MIIILIYLIGAVLAYGRMKASSYEIDEAYIAFLPPEPEEPVFYLIAVLSWIGFFAGIIIYLSGEKYFLKYSYKPLWDLHKKLNS